MEISFLYVGLFLLYNHFICDFLLQDEQWAINKKHSLKVLLSHTIMYSISYTIIGLCATFIYLIISGPMPEYSFQKFINFWLYFGIITFIFHTLTDFFTSKIVGKYFSLHKLGSSIPNWGAFSMIGLDQILHFTQLFITFDILFKIIL